MRTSPAAPGTRLGLTWVNSKTFRIREDDWSSAVIGTIIGWYSRCFGLRNDFALTIRWRSTRRIERVPHGGPAGRANAPKVKGTGRGQSQLVMAGLPAWEDGIYLEGCGLRVRSV